MNTVMTKIRSADENATERLQNIKKVGNAADSKVGTKRAALGELQNRGTQRSVATGKEAVQKESILSEIRNNARPRVDTHWKRGELPSDITTSTTRSLRGLVQQTATIETTGVAKVTRTNSQRLNATRLGAAANANGNAVKVVTTKLIENKLQQAKLIKKVSVDTKLRREDSDVSRRSISKIKAALLANSKDVGTRPVTRSSSGALNNLNSEASVSKVSIEASSKVSVTATTQASGDCLKTFKSEIEEYCVISEKLKLGHSPQTLKAIVDIDEKDKDTLILVSGYVNEIYDYLFTLEEEQPVRPDHLADQEFVKPKMRGVLLDWIVEVHDQFHLSNETYHIAVGIIDRYLQMVKNTRRSMLQLVGATALLIASKYEDVLPPAMSDFVYITDDAYTPNQVMEMESTILHTLDFNLSRPVSIQFLRRFSRVADVQDAQHTMSKYFLELATISYEMASYKPSEIAAASLFLSLNLSCCDTRKGTGFNEDLWTPILQHFSHYKPQHIRPIAQKIAAIARNAGSSKLCAVYKKYQKQKFYKISLNSDLYSPLMDSLASCQ